MKKYMDDIEPDCPSIFNDYEAAKKHIMEEIDEMKEMGSSDDDIEIKNSHDGEINEVDIWLNDAFIIKLNVFAVAE